MARRNIFEWSPPPSSSHASTDADAATAQLLGENRASASRTPNPQPSAVRGADLLNAARVDYRHSSLPRMARNGKLRKVGMFSGPQRQDLARPRDAYAVPDSPEKGGFKLPDKVNHDDSLKRVKMKKTKKAQDVVDSGAVVPSSDGPAPGTHEDVTEHHHETAGGEASVPSSPPKTAEGSGAPDDQEEHDASDSSGDDVGIEGHLPDEMTRCAFVEYKAKQGHVQCHELALDDTGHGPRCSAHMHKLGRVRCEQMVKYGGDHQCPALAILGRSRCTRHDTAEKSQKPESSEEAHRGRKTRANAKRKSEETHADNARPTKSTKRRQEQGNAQDGAEEDAQPGASEVRRPQGPVVNSSPQVQIPVRKSKERGSGAKATQTYQQEVVAESIEEAEPTQSAGGKRTRSKPRNVDGRAAGANQSQAKTSSKSAKDLKSVPTASRQSKRDEDDDDNDDDEDIEHVEASSVHEHEESDEEEVRTAKHPLGTIEHVFEFLDLPKREGRCQTKLGTTINRECERIFFHLEDNDVTLDEVAEYIDELRCVLKQVRKLSDDGTSDRLAIKEDMYGYIFRALTLVLQSLYEFLRSVDENFMRSPEPMRMMVLLMRDILAIKDSIASWKVKVSQRYHGDRIIGDVDSYLIKPLREVYLVFKNRLSRIENDATLRQQAARMRRENEEARAAYARQTEGDEARNERKKRWTALHITRMECEPDPGRWHALTNTARDEDYEERDANGFAFERVEAFTERSTPPLHWGPYMIAASQTTWSDKETVVLIQGMKDFAGACSNLAARCPQLLTY
jgi:hypothetical protein